MRASNRIVVAIAVVAAVAGLMTLSWPLEAAPPDPTSKTVQLACRAGWRGGAGGEYGGVPFSISCASDKQSLVIEGTIGTAYSVRMGAESLGGAFDCFFTGDAERVDERCVEVRLTIR